MPKIGDIPHTALIYSDKQDRNRLIEQCIEGAKASWKSLVLISAQPASDARFYKSKARGSASDHVLDVAGLLDRSRDPVDDFLSLVKAERLNWPTRRRRLEVGDWIHRTYDRFEVALRVEEEEADMTNLICCYRREGFWSLEPTKICRVFELHSRVLLGSSVFEKSNGRTSAFG